MLNLGLGLGLARPRGEVVPPWTPDMISGLIRGWDFEALEPSSDVETVPAAWGTTADLTMTGNPTVENVSINGRGVLRTVTADAERGDFTATGALTNCTLALLHICHPATAASLSIIGAASTGSYFRFTAASGRLTALAVKPTAVSASSNSLNSAGYMWPGGAYLILIRKADGAYTCRINQIETTFTKAGDVNFDRMFRDESTPAYTFGNYIKAALWNRALTDEELVEIENGWREHWDVPIYLAADGDDTNGFGSTPYKPWKGASKATGYGGLAQRSGILWRAGDEFNDAVGDAALTNGASASDRFLLSRYGEGDDPLFAPRARETGWTDNEDGTFSKTGFTSSPFNVFLVADPSLRTEGGVTKLANVTGVGSDLNWEWIDETDEVKVRLGAGLDPNGDAHVRVSTGGRWYDSSAQNVSIRDLNVRYWGSTGIRCNGVFTEALRCQTSWCSDDGFNGQTTNNDLKDGWQVGNGSTVLGSGSGDPASWHGGATGVCAGNYMARNRMGLRCEQYAEVQVSGNVIKENGIDVQWIAQGAGSGAKSSSFVGNDITVDFDRSATDKAIDIVSGVPEEHTFTITGNTLRRASGSGGAAVGNAGGTVVDGGGNTLVGFATLT